MGLFAMRFLCLPLLLLIAASCQSPPPPPPADERPAPSGPLGRIVVGEAFPEIAFPDLVTGEPTTIAAYRGKPYIVHVFASW